jgi:hypothetical protein
MDFFGEEEKEASGNEDHREKIRTQAEEEKENPAEIGAGGTDEVVFRVLRGLGIKREVSGVEREECEQEEDASSEDGEGDHLLTEGRTGADGFKFGHVEWKESN